MLRDLIWQEGIISDDVTLPLLNIFLVKDVLPEQTNIWLVVVHNVVTIVTGDNYSIQGTFINVSRKQLLLLTFNAFTQGYWVWMRCRDGTTSATATANMRVALKATVPTWQTTKMLQPCKEGLKASATGCATACRVRATQRARQR